MYFSLSRLCSSCCSTFDSLVILGIRGSFCCFYSFSGKCQNYCLNVGPRSSFLNKPNFLSGMRVEITVWLEINVLFLDRQHPVTVIYYCVTCKEKRMIQQMHSKAVLDKNCVENSPILTKIDQNCRKGKTMKYKGWVSTSLRNIIAHLEKEQNCVYLHILVICHLYIGIWIHIWNSYFGCQVDVNSIFSILAQQNNWKRNRPFLLFWCHFNVILASTFLFN